MRFKIGELARPRLSAIYRLKLAEMPVIASSRCQATGDGNPISCPIGRPIELQYLLSGLLRAAGLPFSALCRPRAHHPVAPRSAAGPA